MKIFISSDHGGFELKKKIVEYLNSSLDIRNSKFVVEDLGPSTLDPLDDYPLYGIKLAEKVAKEKDSFGILICRSGNGMVIAANKVKGAYAALCFTPKHAQMARRDDNANIVCLDADYGEEETHLEIVKTFLTSEFAGQDTKYGRRFDEVQKYESEHCE